MQEVMTSPAFLMMILLTEAYKIYWSYKESFMCYRCIKNTLTFRLSSERKSYDVHFNASKLIPLTNKRYYYFVSKFILGNNTDWVKVSEKEETFNLISGEI